MNHNVKKYQKPAGSALILVVVVTVLLAVVGVMFLMVSRASELETAAVIQNKDLDNAVNTVVSRINDVLVEDIFGTEPLRPGMIDADITFHDADEPWDYMTHHPGYNNGVGVDGIPGDWDDPISPGLNLVLDTKDPPATNDDIWLPGTQDDYWLASLEPEWFDRGPDDLTGTVDTMADDTYVWPHITDLWGTLHGRSDSLYYQRFVNSDHIYYPQPVSVVWIDPDDTTNPTHFWYGWNTSAKWARWEVSAYNVRANIIQPRDRMDVVAVLPGAGTFPSSWATAAVETGVTLYGARADADGDGVADSRWVPIPGLTTSRGEPVYTAVRIIDNCAMLNLNGAHCFYQEPYDDTDPVSPFARPWFENVDDYGTSTFFHENQGSGSGRYLTEINYLPFLRGSDLGGTIWGVGSGDDWYNLMISKGFWNPLPAPGLPWSPYACQALFMNIENPVFGYQFFDIGEELELRNRHLLTSLTEARVEQTSVWNFTLDAGGGAYAALQIPRDISNFYAWKFRMNPAFFDAWGSAGRFILSVDPLFSYRYRYDRRHVCTFYSYDRLLRIGWGPLLPADLAADDWSAAEIAAAVLDLSWYPLLYSDLMSAGWSPGEIIAAQQMFWPVGPATTDIGVPVYNTTSGLWENNMNNPETRRRILHLLFAFREYFYEKNGHIRIDAAKSAAQVVANLIDYSDDDSLNTLPIRGATEGPFYEDGSASPFIDYGSQANVNSTFITSEIIDDMINEISTAYGITMPTAIDFGLPSGDVVFGYERQPFISEVYVRWDGGATPPSPNLTSFAIELINPYDTDISIEDWKLKIGTAIDHTFAAGTGRPPTSVTTIPAYSGGAPGRLVIQVNSTGTVAGGAVIYNITGVSWTALQSDLTTGSESLVLLKPDPRDPTQFVNVDLASNSDLKKILGFSGNNAMKRDDTDWGFVYALYDFQKEIDSSFTTNTLGTSNALPTGTISSEGFQIGVWDDLSTALRRHDIEVLGLDGNGPESGDQTVSSELAKRASSTTATTPLHFDLAGSSEILMDYVTPMNRPDFGSLPGRININTAPVHVIAAAIPPILADPNAAASPTTVTLSALQLAQKIVDHRQTSGPYEKISDLLNITEFKQYVGSKIWAIPGAENVGNQSIEDDIEEKHWVLSNLANKFTVRSDVFTAYILVRLGQDGPQRRMIAVFDRSQVWNRNDRPRLVALHPVPDPR